MWYVIQVQTGREEQIIEEAGKYQVQEYFDSMFAPHCVKKKKYLGQWHTQQEILFPGYLFVISSRPEELYQALKRVPKFTKLLGTGEKWTPMTEEDIAIVRRLSGKQLSGEPLSRKAEASAGRPGEKEKSERESGTSWLMDFSEGYIQGEKVIVTKGPLKGMESKISRIDRHKRLAWLTVELFGRTVELQAGLEIVRKE